jgi:hypothetical protein
MFETIAAGLGSILGGGLTGLIGAGLTSWTELKKQDSLFRHDEKMAELDQAMTKLEIQGRLKVAETESQALQEIAASDVLQKSFDADRAQYATGRTAANSKWFVWVDVIRGLVRPTLTIYMMLVVTLIYLQIMYLVGGIEGMTTNQATGMLAGIIDSLLYITTTIVLWWFGSRTKGGVKT